MYPDSPYGIQSLKLRTQQRLTIHSVLADGISGLKELKTEKIFLARPAYSKLALPALFELAKASGDHLSFTVKCSD